MDIKSKLAYTFALLLGGSFLVRADDGGDDPIPHCQDCVISTWITKEKATDNTSSCSIQVSSNPWEDFTGKCQRYECSNGHYYTFTGWVWNHCEDHKIEPTSPLCPNDSCVPPANPGDPGQ